MTHSPTWSMTKSCRAPSSATLGQQWSFYGVVPAEERLDGDDDLAADQETVGRRGGARRRRARPRPVGPVDGGRHLGVEKVVDLVAVGALELRSGRGRRRPAS